MLLKSRKEAVQSTEDFRAKMVEERNNLSTDIAELVKRKNQTLLDIQEAETAHSARITKLDSEYITKKRDLASEVSTLEARKLEALKPIKAKEAELKAYEAQINEKEAKLEAVRAELSEERSLLAEKVAQASDSLAEARSQEQKASHRLAKVAEAEELNRKSTNDLALKWLEVRNHAEEANNTLRLRENELELREKEVKAEKEWSVNERTLIAASKRRLDSERAALEHAISHAKKKGYL